MNATADQVVAFDNALAAPRGPNAVWLPWPPKAAEMSLLEKLIVAPAAVPPALVLSNVGVALIVTGPVIPIVPPAVVIFPPTLIAVVPV